MSVTAATDWTHVLQQPNWLMRLFDLALSDPAAEAIRPDLERRLERWLEMIAISVVLVLGVLFTCVAGFFALPKTTWSTWATVALCALPLVMSVIQYAWTFFYLRLEEIDIPVVIGRIPPGARGPGEGAAASAAAPRLKLVEGRSPDSGSH